MQPAIKSDTSVWTGLWAMEANSLRNLAANNAGTQQQQEQQPYAVAGDTAVIPIVGPISKYSSIMQSVFGGVATLDVADQIDKALYDEKIEKIVLYIDSPGGTVAGTTDLGECIAAAKTLKPIIAYVSDHCFSAAYWIASQCTKIVANQGAFVGSIGVYQVLTDTSKAAENAGVQIKLISQGEYKGLTEEGLPIDAKAISEAYRQVNSAYQLFVNAVATGRNLPNSTVIGLADGRIHVAAEALNLKLIDAIGTWDATIAGNLEGLNMSENTNEQEKKVDAAPEGDTDVELLKQVLSAITAITQKLDEMSKDEDEADDDTDTMDEATTCAPDEKAKTNAANERLKAISEACGTRADLAIKSFLAGHSAVEAKAALADVLSAENAQLRKKASVDTVEPLALGGPATSEATSSNDPETVWKQNIGDVQKSFSGKKEYFLAAWKHNKVNIKGTK